MSARLTSLVLGLWVVLAVLLVSLAFNAAHFSPWEFLIPGPDPISWIGPTVLVGPPVALVLARRASPSAAVRMGWGISVLLAGLIVATFVLFHPSALLGDHA